MAVETSDRTSPTGAGAKRGQLVQTVAQRLRDLIFAEEEGARIGSLPEIAEKLSVGIVTVQQAARILEHEGLLNVRRGPNGGYFGARPDAAVLERTLAAYMRTHPAAWEEALDMTSLLFNELVAAAATCTDEALHAELAAFRDQIALCENDADVGRLEEPFQKLLFRMVDRPLFELLTYVTLRVTVRQPPEDVFEGAMGPENWVKGRRRIIAAILSQDPELARFEANRNNREVLLDWLARRKA